MRISIRLEILYPVEMTTALKFLFVVEKNGLKVWGTFSVVVQVVSHERSSS